MRLTKGIVLLVSAACAAVAGLTSFANLTPVWLDGLLFDGALAVRAQLYPKPEPATRVAVIAIDPESLDHPALAKLPRAFFGPIWGQLITDLNNAGAQVVAFDALLPYSASQFQKGYDRPFLTALYRNRSKVVLGRADRTLPAQNYLAALRNDQGALGSLHVEPANDEVYRWINGTQALENGDSYLTLSGAPA